MTVVRARRVCAALAAVLVLTAGCARTASEPPPDLSVVIDQTRLDIARDVMSIRVVNDGGSAVTVVGARYRDERFADDAVWSGERQVPAGRDRDQRVPLPAADCTATDPAVPQAEIRVMTGDADAVVTLDVTDPFDFVARTTAAACFAERFGEVASITLTSVTTAGTGRDELATATFEVTATDDVGIRLESVARTGLLQPTTDTAAWELDARLPPGGAAQVRMEMIPARCDIHAIAEDKVGTRFPVTVAVEDDDDTSGVLVVPADGDQRAFLYSYIERWCAATA